MSAIAPLAGCPTTFGDANESSPPVSVGVTSPHWLAVMSVSFLAAAFASRWDLVAAVGVSLGSLMVAAACLVAARLRWFGWLVLANVGFWVTYGAVISSLPEIDSVVRFVTTEGRVLVALVPLVGLAAATTGPRHLEVLERVFELTAAGLVGVLVAFWIELPLVPRFHRGNFHGLTATHHAPAFIAGLTLIVLIATTRHRWTWWRAVLVGGLFMVILATGSRAGLVGLAVAGLFGAVWRPDLTRLLRSTLALVVGAIAVISLVPRAGQTVERLFDEDFQEQIAIVSGGGERRPTSTPEANILRRVSNWSNARDLIASSPLIGIGAWRYDDQLDVRIGIEGIAAPVVAGQREHSDGHTHNVYLQVLTETGLVGLGLMGSLWTGLLVALRRRGRRPDSPALLAPWLLAAWCGIGFGLGVSLTDVGLINPALTFPLTLVIGATLSFADPRAHGAPG